MNTRLKGVIWAVVALAIAGGAFWATRPRSAPILVLATTTSVQDSGLLDVLLPAFERETGIRVHAVAVGTGQALALARRGDADAVLCHAPALEEAFVREGHGEDRRRVARNDFVVVGPPADPARVRHTRTAAEALARIAAAGQPFVSRGDRSGTHLKEQELWARARVHPEGAWYLSAGSGMGAVLRLASERRAYTLSDRATFVAYRGKVDLAILHAGSEGLDNPYSILVVSPRRHPGTRVREARRFADYLTGTTAQGLIARFGMDRYGEALFRPAAMSGNNK
ncbi:MAG: substrate-binding domain-containing protein [Armatimonadetes bacterium]|nr:substrate-binding domain-containing protein [Armatimonadota bacterium]